MFAPSTNLTPPRKSFGGGRRPPSHKRNNMANRGDITISPYEAFQLYRAKALPSGPVSGSYLKALYIGRAKYAVKPKYNKAYLRLQRSKAVASASSIDRISLSRPSGTTSGRTLTLEMIRKQACAEIRYFKIEARNAYARVYPYADIFIMDFSRERSAESPAIVLPDTVLVEGSLIIRSLTANYTASDREDLPPYYPISNACTVILASKSAQDLLLTVKFEQITSIVSA